MWEKDVHFGKYIGNMLDQCIQAGILGPDATILSKYIIKAGPGDYVEIGTAFGASAILAALTKRVFQIPGDVYSIDNYSRGVTPEDVMKNAKIFGVDDMIHLCVANSHPWPLGWKKFVFGLIDGNHSGLMPARDFINMSKRVTNYIMLDDIGCVSHPNIAVLASRICSRGEWGCARATNKVMVLQRVHKCPINY